MSRTTRIFFASSAVVMCLLAAAELAMLVWAVREILRVR